MFCHYVCHLVLTVVRSPLRPFTEHPVKALGTKMKRYVCSVMYGAVSGVSAERVNKDFLVRIFGLITQIAFLV